MAIFERPDGIIGYDDTGGGGPVVIAIPGMGDLRSEYRLLAPQLAAAGHRVITIDIRGHGESSARWPDYSAHAVGRDVLALMDHLAIDRAQLIGTSFAAGSVLWVAADAPQRVAGVVLFGAVLRDLPVAWWKRAVLALGFAGPWRVAFWMAFWTSLFTRTKPDDHRVVAARLSENLAEPGRMAALKAMVDLSKADTEAMTAGIAVPVLSVMGSRDPDFGDPASEAAWGGRRMGAETMIVDGVGHYPQVEAIDQIAPRVIEFLARHR